MLVLKRKEGQWLEVTHRSGDVLRIRVCRIEPGIPGQLNLAFDDEARNFEIERPERRRRALDPATPSVQLVPPGSEIMYPTIEQEFRPPDAASGVDNAEGVSEAEA